MNTQLTPQDIQSFVGSLKAAIQHSQLKAVKAVNTYLLELYFVLGAAISVKTKQANWGDKVLEKISKELQKEVKGLRGFSAQNLKKMRLFYEAYPEQLTHCSLWQEFNTENTLEIGSTLSNETPSEIGSTVSNQLKDTFWNISFSNHFSIISKVSEPEARLFYIEQNCAKHKRFYPSHG